MTRHDAPNRQRIGKHWGAKDTSPGWRVWSRRLPPRISVSEGGNVLSIRLPCGKGGSHRPNAVLHILCLPVVCSNSLFPQGELNPPVEGSQGRSLCLLLFGVVTPVATARSSAAMASVSTAGRRGRLGSSGDFTVPDAARAVRTDARQGGQPRLSRAPDDHPQFPSPCRQRADVPQPVPWPDSRC